jgi:hypothetical protein
MSPNHENVEMLGTDLMTPTMAPANLTRSGPGITVSSPISSRQKQSKTKQAEKLINYKNRPIYLFLLYLSLFDSGRLPSLNTTPPAHRKQ